MDLISLSKLKLLMNKYDIKPNKKMGQNFLIDNNIIQKIIREAGVAGGYVFEIGPGMGSLTIGLAQVAKKVIAVELDKKLIPVLKETVGAYPNVEIINDDALKVDFDGIMKQRGIEEPYNIVANLPYYITTPIIMHLLESGFNIDKLVFMIQKEVAARMVAKPGTKDYGALTLGVQYYTQVFHVAKIPPTVFVPRPEVDSAVVKLIRRPEPLVVVKNEEFLFKVVKAGFGKRRKTLLNSLFNSELNLTKELITEACLLSQIDPQKRMEQLSMEEIAKLADHLVKVDLN
ncbi:16S rRNA (adenine(1518)-N(6)/adenine(1519)-N(6))-dimethyltransferase RsmA [Desulfitibacter alkalitolerans]|uniref:16S rRNA (adenine(1518)-N(6)/adenine(1519)-N(6))- dimethyltransferase RsmA n=1 Tax=Desulfitibacter alkalitolerans TaxID=264641 RepID=UPI000485F484|nr:16S rRNA (adenine(1518)-N(6)/adenine(1519)-N(6))-dimethyltransferase RsmA [Desulfitibacter alkalitolerans]